MTTHFLARCLAGLVLVGAALGLGPLQAVAEPELKFPIIFTSTQQLAPFGIWIDDGDPANAPPSNFRKACFDGSDVLPDEPRFLISDALYARYKAKGFTIESLCMAMSSRAKFDPESGKRLPTFVLRNDKAISREIEQLTRDAAADPESVPFGYETRQAFFDAMAAIKRGDFSKLTEDQLRGIYETKSMTWERPLAVPLCFKNGTPYLDCTWRKGLSKGAPISNERKRLIGDIGAAIDRQVQDAIQSRKPLKGLSAGSNESTFFFENIIEGLYDNQPQQVLMPQELFDHEKFVITWLRVSPALPRGYGYSFYASRVPDGVFSLDVFLPTLSAERLDPDRIKAVLAEYE